MKKCLGKKIIFTENDDFVSILHSKCILIFICNLFLRGSERQGRGRGERERERERERRERERERERERRERERELGRERRVRA